MILKRWTLALIFIFIATLPVFAQDGFYNLNISGVVTNENGIPSAFKTVQIMTDAGEGIEVQTDGTGHFTITGMVKGTQGTITVKSSHADNVVFGSMPLAWSAGSFGDKALAADLIINKNGDMTLQGGGTENFMPTNNDVMAAEPPALPTVTPTIVAPADSPAPTQITPVEKPDENNDGSGSIILLIIGGLFGLALIGGGVWYLITQKKG